MSQSSGYYPKSGKEGGALIRKVIAFLRKQGVQLPISSHILIAISGGSDSVGLAHLLCHFGRRIISKDKISLLHINHGWRGEESIKDSLFVQELGVRWDFPVIVHTLSPLDHSLKTSWEEEARNSRKKIYAQEAKKLGGIVFTAHQADDLAETVLWRIFTGAAKTHGGGIAFQHGVEFRPLLKSRKSEIKAYLQEVGEAYREDSTNRSTRFLRAHMRSQLIPEVEKIFPKAIHHLVELALDAQEQVTLEGEGSRVNTAIPPYEELFRATGLKVRRSHWNEILKKEIANPSWSGEIHLPGGWRLTCEKKRQKKESSVICSTKKDTSASWVEKWVLERA